MQRYGLPSSHMSNNFPIPAFPLASSLCSALEAFIKRISPSVCWIWPVNTAVSSCKPREIFAILPPSGIMIPTVIGTDINMISVIFQSIMSKIVTAPIIEMTPVMNCGKCCVINSFTMPVSLTYKQERVSVLTNHASLSKQKKGRKDTDAHVLSTLFRLLYLASALTSSVLNCSTAF